MYMYMYMYTLYVDFKIQCTCIWCTMDYHCVLCSSGWVYSYDVCC